MKLTGKGFISDPETINGYRTNFLDSQCIYIPQLIDKELYANFLSQLNAEQFYENEHLGLQKEVFAKDQTLRVDNILLMHLHFLINNSDLFAALEQITGCGKIKKFVARVYQNLPNSTHHLDWHDDLSEQNRLLGFSLNLSSNKYLGGKFQLREKVSKKILREIPCGEIGDVHIFNISKSIEHQVTKTEGEFPRIAAAGWFKSI